MNHININLGTALGGSLPMLSLPVVYFTGRYAYKEYKQGNANKSLMISLPVFLITAKIWVDWIGVMKEDFEKIDREYNERREREERAYEEEIRDKEQEFKERQKRKNENVRERDKQIKNIKKGQVE